MCASRRRTKWILENVQNNYCNMTGYVNRHEESSMPSDQQQRRPDGQKFDDGYRCCGTMRTPTAEYVTGMGATCKPPPAGAYAGIDGGGVSTFLNSFLPFPLPPLPLSFPFPPLSLASPIPFLPLLSPPLGSRAPLNQLGVWGNAVSSPGQKRIWCTL